MAVPLRESLVYAAFHAVNPGPLVEFLAVDPPGRVQELLRLSHPQTACSQAPPPRTRRMPQSCCRPTCPRAAAGFGREIKRAPGRSKVPAGRTLLGRAILPRPRPTAAPTPPTRKATAACSRSPTPLTPRVPTPCNSAGSRTRAAPRLLRPRRPLL